MSAAPSKKLTLDLVARYPRSGTSAPGRIAYAPDGRAVTYLHSERGDLVRDLYRFDLDSGRVEQPFVLPDVGVTDENVSREEALRRERQRLREMGVTHYVWAERAPVLFVPLRGDLYRIDAAGVRRIAERVTDPKPTADGERVFFVRADEVWCVDGAGERRLTSDAEPGVANGVAEFVAQEEMARHTGLWPSPDGRLVAFEQYDERHIPEYPIVHQGKDAVEVERHRYPFSGAENARVRLGVVPAEGGEPRWLDLRPEVPGADQDFYLARVDWHPDGRLFVQVLSRDQRRLDLFAFDVASGRRTLLLSETSDLWINLHPDLRFVATSGELVWSSERTGFRHLYLYDRDGHLVRPLTSGDWPVDAVLALDASGRRVYFAAGKTSPLERHVYAVPLDGGEPLRLTEAHGTHDAVFAPDFSSFVDVHQSLRQPPSVTVRRKNGTEWRVLHAASEIEVDLPPPELHQFRSRDGAALYAAVYRPPGPGPFPLVVAVYGGPHVQAVADTWNLTVDLRAQYFAQNGFVVLKVDNRGSARRGLAFEGAIVGNMGDLEVRDQVDGVRWLTDQGVAEPGRVGIYGWSYGGYMSALALVKAPEVFRVAVAGAPVTHWDGYDTCYTERYMRTPATNPEGYRRSAVMTHAEALVGKLMLVHGMVDENVHFRHTARLINALIEANKPYDLLIYPNERHMPRSEKDRVAMETQIVDYFARNL